jgi:plastocyanin
MKTNQMKPNSKFTAATRSLLPRSFAAVSVMSLFLLASMASLSAATIQVQVGANGGNAFAPKDVSIQVGDTVQWTWQGDNHSVTSGVPGNPDGLFDSGVQNTGFTFSFTFNDPGLFPYFCTVHGACCGMVGSVTVGQPTPTPTPTPPLPLITKGNIQIELQTVASGLTAPIDLEDAADGSGRLFIVEQTGKIKILKSGTILPTPFLDVTNRLVILMPAYDERGLLGLAFHPDFNNPSAVGYHKIYTYTSEPVSVPADFTVPDLHPFDCQSVIAEWQVSASNPNVIDPATRREVVRIDKPEFNHNGGHLAFSATDYELYISLGDGGNANDVGPGHNPRTGNGQDKTIILGKILRIDPRDPALTTGDQGGVSKNGKYRIPRTNPFFYQPPSIAELFTYGMRNPYRYSFDALTDQLIIADVGQDNIEEIDIGGSGNNYGWNRKEGTFLFNHNNGSIRPDHHIDPTLTEPVAEYCHFDGAAIIGGFVYRGKLAAPVLTGKYAFGDLAPAGATSGRLFFSDLANSIFEFRIGAQDVPLGAFLKGFGQDAANEVYVLDDTNIGPSGTGGEVRKIISAIIVP